MRSVSMLKNAIAVGTGDNLLAYFNVVKQLGRYVHVASHAAAIFNRHHRQLRPFLLYLVIEVQQL